MAVPVLAVPHHLPGHTNCTSLNRNYSSLYSIHIILLNTHFKVDIYISILWQNYKTPCCHLTCDHSVALRGGHHLTVVSAMSACHHHPTVRRCLVCYCIKMSDVRTSQGCTMYSLITAMLITRCTVGRLPAVTETRGPSLPGRGLAVRTQRDLGRHSRSADSYWGQHITRARMVEVSWGKIIHNQFPIRQQIQQILC